MSNQYSLRLRRNSRSNKKGSTDKKPDKRIYKKLSHPECFIDRSIGLKAEVSVDISYEGNIGKICKREKYYMKHIISFLIDSMYVDVPLGRSKVCIGPITLQW